MKSYLMSAMLVVLYLADMPASAAVDTSLCVDADNLIIAMAMTETHRLDPNAAGDMNLKYRAHGLLQIRKPYLDDVNRIVGKQEMRRIWGESSLTMAAVNNPEKAVWITKVYLSHYGKVYEKKTGNKPTHEVYARIHNGGPNGHSRECTLRYWKKVNTVLTAIKKHARAKSSLGNAVEV